MLTPPDTRALARMAAVLSLSRMRAVEAVPGEDGLKAVWHRCAAGADLLSAVDGQGRLRRQEFTLLEDFFLWTEEEGLRTGALVPEPSGAGPGVAATVLFDAVPLPERILRAAAALADYRGEDRFLLHLRERVCEAQPAAHALAAEERAQGRRVLAGPVPGVSAWVVAGVVVLGMVALAAWLS